MICDEVEAEKAKHDENHGLMLDAHNDLAKTHGLSAEQMRQIHSSRFKPPSLTSAYSHVQDHQRVNDLQKSEIQDLKNKLAQKEQEI